MKRTFIATIALATMVFAGFAFAHPGAGFGPGYGAGNCWGAQQGNQAASVDEKGARKMVEEYMDKNLKGYDIKDVQTYTMPRGTMHQLTVKDKAGNTFAFRVNPWGNMVGPFPVPAAQ